MSLLYNNYWTYAIVLRGYNGLLKGHLKYLEGFVLYLKRNYGME
jgi:hypothetical protein